jgi:thiamine kinase-like enzyme
MSNLLQVARIKEAMRQTPEPLAPCNNDLLPANFIDDGKNLWLIDYEYSGNNEGSFEIGNIWSEANLSLEDLEQLVTAYWGSPRPDKVARARLWGLLSKYGWTLWAVIQANASTIEFEFFEWGMEKYIRAVDEFNGPDFEALINSLKTV